MTYDSEDEDVNAIPVGWDASKRGSSLVRVIDAMAPFAYVFTMCSSSGIKTSSIASQRLASEAYGRAYFELPQNRKVIRAVYLLKTLCFQLPQNKAFVRTVPPISNST